MKLAREKAAQAWCTPTTESKEMDVDLAEAFADILEEVWSKPWLGNATTGELLEELSTRILMNEQCQNIGCKRCGLNYKTVGPHCQEEPESEWSVPGHPEICAHCGGSGKTPPSLKY